ncbi:hypothetical protein EVAR_83989_1 [Eumeta japonica]|uniref:Uncharacterized protein n=1 Tax=Eumeta variegata TaxID=151549 RepID=A0A4C1VQ39_EUMVA|nr:hypothetical protein EVAR_83989_1 [Eumeta japonica]
MRSFRGNGATNTKVTLDKIYTSEIISSVLEILHFHHKQGSGPCSVEKVNYLDVINVPYTKMCIRTVMTYASPVFAHAAQKHYIDYRTPHYFQIYEGRIEAILRHRGITSQCAPTRRLTINRRIPVSVGHETYLPIHLTLLAAVESPNDVNDMHD